MEIDKTKKGKSKKATLILVIVLLLLVVAVSFAYYFAVLKGENINTSKMAGATLVYTEPDAGTETVQMSDYEGMKSKPYEFSIRGNAAGTTTLDYAIYIEELSGNTVAKSDIKYYLTDENDIPVFLDVRKPFYNSWSSPESNNDVIITPNGENKIYTKYTDVSIKDKTSSDIITIEQKVSNVDTYYHLLSYYASDVLGLADSETFNVQEGENCYKVTYSETDNTVDIDYLNKLNSNSCVISYDASYDDGIMEYRLRNKSDNKILYTATYSDDYMEFSDSSKFNGDVISYIANELNIQTNGSFYVKDAYTVLNPNDNELEVLSSYCVKYTFDGEYYNDSLANDSSCENAYTNVIGEPFIHTIGDLDTNYTNEYSDISNIIKTDSIYFADGEATLNGRGGLLYAENRTKNPLRTYKLRYWISNSAIEKSNTGKTEGTTKTEGKKHTAEFGGTGIFKFKVNVYAVQNNE